MTATDKKEQQTLEGLRTLQYKMLADPLRTKILMVLGNRDASPKELAEELDEDFQRVCRQVRVLRDHEFIELVDTDMRRGGVQHFYRATVRPLLDADEWEQIPAFAREANSADILQVIGREAREALESGDFDAHRHRVLIQKPLLVDEQGMREADESAVRHLEDLTRIEAESAARRIRGGGRVIQIRTALMIHPAAGSGLKVDKPG